jgi:HK97 family phage major capsid protein/HK97 family phage prohead protease
MKKRTAEELAAHQFAYSTFEIKSIDEEKREIEGWATTPEPDRMGDIVEPEGAEFKLPVPLLWQHNSRQPIGEVIEAKVSKQGIKVRVRLAKLAADAPQVLKDRIEEAWHSVKSKLVKAFSIGFRSKEHSEIEGSWAYRFIRWEWLELSLVTIPANAEATITAIKSADQRARAALGAKGTVVVRLDKSNPGASGKTAATKTGNSEMKTYKEQIKDLEATRAAKAAALAEIQKLAGEKGETKDADQREQFDTLVEDIRAIDGELKDLQVLESLNLGAAEPVDNTKGKTTTVPNGSAARVTINAKLDPGVRFARMAMCVARAKHLQKSGHFMMPSDIYRTEKGWMESAPEVHLALKTAVNANDSTTAAGALEWAYAQNIASEFVEYLRPMTLIGRIQGWRRVPFNVRVGGMDGGSTGYWTGQGLAVPVSRPTSNSISLGITKVGGICVITKELAMLSTPSAEAMVRDDLARALQQKADASLINPNEGGSTNVQPASLTYNVTARQASGTDFAAFKADWKAMTSNFYANNISLSGAVVIMKEELAEALSLMVTSLGLPQFPSMQDWASGNGRLMGRPVLTTQVADTTGSPDWDNLLILLQPNQVFFADDGGASVEASDQVSLQMDDAPTNKSTATATGASVVSMFQTDSIAIKALRHVNWTKARSQACQLIRSAAYV